MKTGLTEHFYREAYKDGQLRSRSQDGWIGGGEVAGKNQFYGITELISGESEREGDDIRGQFTTTELS